ncbi:LuxR C-terminal-related transcriptional regulator [Streptomyces sp. NPDC005576]|uniref:helix-turn-helix transcriptional regulator n=1 Tax=unclassified Streptomyces TaxID=2593676 RepID=UPI0033F868A9
MIDQRSPSPRAVIAPPNVVVLTDDPLTRDGTYAFMAAGGRTTVLPQDRLAEADVVVVITSEVTRDTLAAMSRVGRSTGRRARIVLVADQVAEPHLSLAVRHGTVAVLPRLYTSFTQIETAAVAAHRGEPAPGPVTPGGRPGRPRTEGTERPAAVRPRSDLEPREVHVLRLLAEGRDVAEIAAELSYSERLIKSVIHTAVKRLGQRNRTQAVAHAIRMDIL